MGTTARKARKRKMMGCIFSSSIFLLFSSLSYALLFCSTCPHEPQSDWLHRGISHMMQYQNLTLQGSVVNLCWQHTTSVSLCVRYNFRWGQSNWGIHHKYINYTLYCVCTLYASVLSQPLPPFFFFLWELSVETGQHHSGMPFFSWLPCWREKNRSWVGKELQWGSAVSLKTFLDFQVGNLGEGVICLQGTQRWWRGSCMKRRRRLSLTLSESVDSRGGQGAAQSGTDRHNCLCVLLLDDVSV